MTKKKTALSLSVNQRGSSQPPRQSRRPDQMITPKDLYSVLTAVVPLYTTMLLGYASVRWWRLFTPEQCAGINRFVAVFAVPLLSFQFISRVDLARLHLPFIAADGASKLLTLAGVLAWAGLARRGSLEWAITAFSLVTLPNTLVMGIPLLKSMYGDEQEGLMVQVVMLQSVIWYTLLLFLFEYRAARGVAIQGGSAAMVSSNLHQVPPQAEEDGEKDEEEEDIEAQGRRGSDAEKTPGRSTMSPSQMVKTILSMVWWKLAMNPNSYASLLGLSWTLASWRWNIKKPQIIENSITILSDAGLGMAMFSLGLFMALQPRIVACGYRLAAYGMVLRFLAGPAMMSMASLGVGLRGKILSLSIVQAALPQGIVPFVFAREYNVHADVLSTAVIFGMIVSLPITVLYYILLSFYVA